MHIRAPQRLDRVEPLTSRRARRRRTLWWMLGGSLLLHLVLAGLFILFVPEAGQPVEEMDTDQVQMLFQPGEASREKPSSASDKPDAPNAVAAGTPAPAPTETVPDQSTVAPTGTSEPAPTATPPATPPDPAPPDPAPPNPAPPDQPIVEASIPQPVPPPEAPPAPPPPPAPAPPRPPATVSLQVPPAPEPLLPLPPPFVPPEAPPVLPRAAPPSPPRSAPPRIARSQPPRNPFALNAPQNWSFNAAPNAPGIPGARHGFDFSVSDQAGRKDTAMQYVRGAHPGADWEAKVHAWIAAHSYYPQEAASQGHEGTATVFLRIDRSGRVLSVQLIGSAHEPFLDGAWVDAWRGGTVPAFPAGVTDDVAEFNYTVYYRLIRR